MKREILSDVRFGHRVAEQELDQLHTYFVETDLWKRVFAGEIDIVYGPKGVGKSAIYGLLLSRVDSLFDNRVLLAPAENPQGELAFAGVAAEPPTSEAEFRGLWKLYLLSLCGRVLREYEIPGEESNRVTRILEDHGLLARGQGLPGAFSAARYYVSRALRPESLEAGMEIDSLTGMPRGFKGKITFQEPAPEALKDGYISVDHLLNITDSAFDSANYDLWLLLDRLDVAFAESAELEKNALRALFRVYLDLAGSERIGLKIFLRTDIWNRITAEGFREASHITKHTTISWDTPSLLNLIVRRVLRNEPIQDYLEVKPDIILSSTDEQIQLFRAYLFTFSLSSEFPSEGILRNVFVCEHVMSLVYILAPDEGLAYSPSSGAKM